MSEDPLLSNLMKGNGVANAGPHAKELLLEYAEQAYNNDNQLHSALYQVRALYHALQQRYSFFESCEATPLPNLTERMNAWERQDFKNNPLMQYAMKKLTAAATTASKVEPKINIEASNFLYGIVDPDVGIRKIQDFCQEMPKEWTILQLCKGPSTDNTFSTFPRMYSNAAAIYLTVLRHARSSEYPQPLCLRFWNTTSVDLFLKFSSIAGLFKQSINVDPKALDRRAKQLYWDRLHEIDQYIATAIEDFKSLFYPWNFLFMGRPNPNAYSNCAEQRRWEAKVFASVDDFCADYKWESRERVFLSLAALHVLSLSDLELRGICMELTSSEREQAAASKLLLKLKIISIQQGCISLKEEDENLDGDSSCGMISQHYPCILIVDERLDHFYWEELNVKQEFTRVNSLQCLWRLFVHYRQRIRGGYLSVNISDGGCLVDPDSNLPHSTKRLRSFFEYWTPHWHMKFNERATQPELFEDFFKRPCYVYAGHGSGLQYVNGKHIANQEMDNCCVVFLFGCDSSRMHSNGLNSDLLGPHLYYQAALCPTLVGTIMPGLDANMDGLSTNVLSRWIAPSSKKITPWANIERVSWSKEGLIKPKSKATESAASDHKYFGSLCAILARVHQRIYEAKLYNTVPYVCRGLPAWNCDVQALSK